LLPNTHLLWIYGGLGQAIADDPTAAQGAKDGILFTPTYIVNGMIYPGSHSVEEFSEIIEPLVADK
jgi:protein-disulfide isomerase